MMDDTPRAAPRPSAASDNPASRERTAAPGRFDLPGGYSAVRRGSWSWVIHLGGEPLRLPCGDLVAIDGDGEQVRVFLATIGVEVCQ